MMVLLYILLALSGIGGAACVVFELTERNSNYHYYFALSTVGTVSLALLVNFII